jgi:hypothetical protein
LEFLQSLDAKKSVPSMGKKLEDNDRFADAFQNAKAQKSESSNVANNAAIAQAVVAAQNDASNPQPKPKNDGGTDRAGS